MIDPTVWTNDDAAGLLPCILLADDPRPCMDQLNERYMHGGGFHPMPGRWNLDIEKGTIEYPGDPIYRELSRTVLPLSEEVLILFQASFMAIIQKDGSYQVCRVD